MKDVKELCKDLSVEAMQKVNGGFKIFGWYNPFSSECEFYLFGYRLYHGSDASRVPRY